MNEEIATDLLRRLGVAATVTNIGYVLEACTPAPAPVSTKKKAADPAPEAAPSE